MSTPVAAPDALIGGRYRLLRARALDSETGAGDLWRAQDEVLARAVAVRLLPANDPRVDALLAAAARAGRASDTRLARVLDASLVPAEGADADPPTPDVRRKGKTRATAPPPAAASDPGPAGFAYVVGEWVDGESLGSLLRSAGPLDPRRATTIVLDVAQALAAAHAQGLAHLRLHPDNVLLTRAGEVKVTDLEVAAALAGRTAADPRAEDARWLGRLLYAALTARWPQGGDSTDDALAGPVRPGLPPAPLTDGHPASPRQVRAGVPREVDTVAERALATTPRRGIEPLRTPAAVAAALAALPQTRPEVGSGDIDEFGYQPGRPEEPSRTRKLARIAGPLALVAGIGAIGWLAGLAIGRVPGPGRGFSSSASSPASPGGSLARPVIKLRTGAVSDFDPDGDGHENPDQVPLATDGDPSTAWQTSAYQHRPDFGGLKPGVGLLVDLGRSQAVGSVTVLLTTPGADLELRAGDAQAASETGYRTVATATDAGRHSPKGTPAGTVVLTPTTGARPARYWLIWITRLPKVGATYSDGIAELTFRR